MCWMFSKNRAIAFTKTTQRVITAVHCRAGNTGSLFNAVKCRINTQHSLITVESHIVIVLEPSPNPAWFDTPLPQVIVLDSQVRVFVKLLYYAFDIVRGFARLLHRFANLAGTVSMLQGFLGSIIKNNIFSLRLPCPAGRAAKYSGSFDCCNKNAFVDRILSAYCVVFFLEGEFVHPHQLASLQLRWES